MTSAPSHASSCVQVGPDCTWVKSRIRTPSSALPMAGSRGRLLVHRLVLGPRRVLARINPDVHDGGAAHALHRLTPATKRGGYLRGVPDLLAIAAKHFGELAERDVAKQGADAAA